MKLTMPRIKKVEVTEEEVCIELDNVKFNMTLDDLDEFVALCAQLSKAFTKCQIEQLSKLSN